MTLDLAISASNKTGKFTNRGKFNNTLESMCQRGNQIVFLLRENRNTTYQNVWDAKEF